jgi:hypothetical protein
MRLATVIVTKKNHFIIVLQILMTISLFEQSTRKCNEETYEGKKEFLEKIEGMKVKARLFGFAPAEYVDNEFKRRKEKMQQLAWQRGWKNSSDTRIRI